MASQLFEDALAAVTRLAAQPGHKPADQLEFDTSVRLMHAIKPNMDADNPASTLVAIAMVTSVILNHVRPESRDRALNTLAQAIREKSASLAEICANEAKEVRTPPNTTRH